MKLLSVAVIAACLSGCVSNPGVVPDGPDAYRIMAVGKTGFSSSGGMQSDNYRRATEYCQQQGKVVETLDTDSKQARPLGGYPEASLRFKCVNRTEQPQ